MPNHYHLQVRSTQGRISEAMRDLGGRYARYYNRRHQRRGALFAGRFKSVLITTDRQLIVTWAYILRNPTSLGVTDLTTYPWSSAAAYLHHQPPPTWLHTATITAHIGHNHLATTLADTDTGAMARAVSPACARRNAAGISVRPWKSTKLTRRSARPARLSAWRATAARLHRRRRNG